MLKNIVDDVAYTAFPDNLKAEYKKSGDTYVLQHDEDTGELKRSKDREKVRADELAVKLSQEQSAHAITKADATKVGTPLEIATKAKAEALKEVQPKLDRADKLEMHLKTTSLSTAANDIATQVGGDKNKIALLPHIERRLDVVLDDNDQPQIVVKGADGKATTQKLEDLVKEVRADKNLASLVMVATPTGGVGRPTPQSPASSAGDKTKSLEQMNMQERREYIKTNIMSASAN